MHDVATLLHPSVEAPTGADDVTPAPVPPPAAPETPAGASLALAGIVLGLVVVGGIILHVRPGPNVLDTWAFSAFPGSLQSSLLHAVTDLGLFPVTAGFALVAAAWVWRRDRRRALACLCGPALAVGLAELTKMAVGRRFEGTAALSWPSGTTAAVAAVVAVVVLVTRRRARAVAVVAGTAVVAVVAIALVAYRWHYMSDALGGIALGVGTILLVDALVHRIPERYLRRRPRPPEPAT
jgi:undecaprenyl-diphosphatase